MPYQGGPVLACSRLEHLRAAISEVRPDDRGDGPVHARNAGLRRDVSERYQPQPVRELAILPMGSGDRARVGGSSVAPQQRRVARGALGPCWREQRFLANPGSQRTHQPSRPLRSMSPEIAGFGNRFGLMLHGALPTTASYAEPKC